jgi:hypothetical protein
MIRNVHVEGHRPQVYIRTVCLSQLVRVSVLHKSELNTDKTNNAYIYNYSNYYLQASMWPLDHPYAIININSTFHIAQYN